MFRAPLFNINNINNNVTRQLAVYPHHKCFKQTSTTFDDRSPTPTPFDSPATPTPFDSPATPTPFDRPATPTPFDRPATPTPFDRPQTPIAFSKTNPNYLQIRKPLPMGINYPETHSILARHQPKPLSLTQQKRTFYDWFSPKTTETPNKKELTPEDMQVIFKSINEVGRELEPNPELIFNIRTTNLMLKSTLNLLYFQEMTKNQLPTIKRGVTVSRYANKKAMIEHYKGPLKKSIAQFGMSTHLPPNVEGFSPMLSTLHNPCDIFMSCSGEGSHCPADSTEDQIVKVTYEPTFGFLISVDTLAKIFGIDKELTELQHLSGYSKETHQTLRIKSAISEKIKYFMRSWPKQTDNPLAITSPLCGRDANINMILNWMIKEPQKLTLRLTLPHNMQEVESCVIGKAPDSGGSTQYIAKLTGVKEKITPYSTFYKLEQLCKDALHGDEHAKDTLFNIATAISTEKLFDLSDQHFDKGISDV